MTYLITFACYGCHLHGEESGSVDPGHHVPGTPILEPDSARAAWEAQRMDQSPYRLDAVRRTADLEAIREVCGHRGWSLLAAHVRSTHLHAVVGAEIPPERVMNDFKACASRRLKRMGLDGANRKRWARVMRAHDGSGIRSMLSGHPVRRGRAGRGYERLRV